MAQQGKKSPRDLENSRQNLRNVYHWKLNMKLCVAQQIGRTRQGRWMSPKKSNSAGFGSDYSRDPASFGNIAVFLSYALIPTLSSFYILSQFEIYHIPVSARV